MPSENAWNPGGDTTQADMYQLYRAADRTSPPAPVIAQAGRTRGVTARSSSNDTAFQRTMMAAQTPS
jgi:hypothetical protein